MIVSSRVAAAAETGCCGVGTSWAKLEQLFDNKSNRGGRPNIDVIVILKSLYIQQLYNLSDEQLKRELADRISFRVSLDTTEIIPDSTTIWKFKERLAKNGNDAEIWIDLQRQLDES